MSTVSVDVDQEFCSKAKGARILGVSIATVNRLVDEGRIRIRHLPGSSRPQLYLADLRELIAAGTRRGGGAA